MSDVNNNIKSSQTPKDSGGGEFLSKIRTYLKDNPSPVNDKVSSYTTRSVTSTTIPVKGMSNILDALLSKSLITIDQFNTLKFESINTNKSIEQLLIEHRIITQEELTKTYAEMKGVGYVNLRELIIPLETLNLLPASLAKSSMAIVFEASASKVKMAMKDPLDLQKINYLESVIGKKAETFFASEEDILYTIDNRYGAQIGKEVDLALEEAGDDNLVNINTSYAENELNQDIESAPIIKIVNMILDYGIKHQASDIHIEPREKRIVVRFRIRGILSEKLTIPRKLLAPIVTRIKILSNLKIDEHRIPQDGRFQARGSGKLVDLRVSIMPSIYGEKVVMRLLEKTQGVMSLEDLGLRGMSLNRVKDALKKTQGIILVTGPTGSGKTQTLASCQKILNMPDVNILTLEDPVEIRIDGVTQVQVNADVGLTFATGLRSFLRQDPDIILVGEIRDSETANLAVQAALVGRLVLSTIHTNSAAGAFVRLIDMGVEPFLLTSTVNLLVAQRLVRVLCECKEPYQAPPEIVKELHDELDVLNGVNIYSEDHHQKLHFGADTTEVTLYKPVGCPKCNDTGYSSRMAIFEALKMSDSIAKLVINKASISDINNMAIQEGMITIVQDGFLKVLEGITTIEEVLRVKNE
jgi:type IV pilus assembly protein PilB